MVIKEKPVCFTVAVCVCVCGSSAEIQPAT